MLNPHGSQLIERFIVRLFVIIMFLAGASSLATAKPNVLFIAVDDLRPQLGCYGFDSMHTPNIDRLASSGTVFRRAYCMVPTCGASRASLMTGLRPTPKRFVNYMARADKDAPGVLTLNTHFKNNGYYTISNGKIFHYTADNAQGWSEPAWRPKGQQWQDPENQKLHAQRSNKPGKRGRGPAYESFDMPDDDYRDAKTTKRSIQDLQRLAKKKQPFFLAVGYYKPHLPFVAPKKYWDLYKSDQIKLPKIYHRPKNAPDVAIHSFGELRAYAGIPKRGPVSNETALKMIHGYYACVSFIDAQVGQLLSELDRLKLADNTIVILWGDHGWNLGEHTLWCKHCCFETSMHAPLIIKAPGIAGGKTTDALTEFIDIYPSLSELAGLKAPAHLDGSSFLPLMKNPNLPWKSAAIGRYRTGDTIRTDRYRFTEYLDRSGKTVARMLYDHKIDPAEDENISENQAHQQGVQNLTKQLRAGKGK
jgi:iduronate 2-sulfatase